MNAQKQRDTAHNRTVQLLRTCYRSFLLHLILSLCIAVTLLLAVMGLSSFMPKIPVYLQTAALFLHRPCDVYALSKPTAAQAVLECAIYFPDGVSEPSIPLSHHSTSDPERHSLVKQQIKDPTFLPPLEKPTLTDPVLTEPETKSILPADHVRILTADLSMSDQHTDTNGGILFSNQTGYQLKAADFLNAEYPIEVLSQTAAIPDKIASNQAPLVLILHTHGTEAYAPDGAAAVPRSYAYRSENTDENIVSVGAVLAKTLQDAGIGVLHFTTLFDAASYNDSYANAAAYIRQTVDEYPSIAYIFDVHRDALQSSDGSMLRPITKIGEEVCAQIMSVVGTDGAGAHHPDWRDNLTVAVQLQKRLNHAYPSFARPINLRTATFNAQYASGSILLEIGAAGNSVTEARSAAYHLGLVLADLILDP